MKIVETVTLIERGDFPKSESWKRISEDIHAAITAVEWPVGSGQFTIRPAKHGNGVKPIKLGLIADLRAKGWNIEHPFSEVDDANRTAATVAKPGDFDAVLIDDTSASAVEWETGNISSSHRALNKMALGLKRGTLASATLVVPSNVLYPFLTDRIGNVRELRPYFDLWRDVTCENGVLQIVVIEHDAADTNAPLIPKGKDGNAKKAKVKVKRQRRLPTI